MQLHCDGNCVRFSWESKSPPFKGIPGQMPALIAVFAAGPIGGGLFQIQLVNFVHHLGQAWIIRLQPKTAQNLDFGA
jgi:hypothetical protein